MENCQTRFKTLQEKRKFIIKNKYKGGNIDVDWALSYPEQWGYLDKSYYDDFPKEKYKEYTDKITYNILGYSVSPTKEEIIKEVNKVRNKRRIDFDDAVKKVRLVLNKKAEMLINAENNGYALDHPIYEDFKEILIKIKESLSFIKSKNFFKGYSEKK